MTNHTAFPQQAKAPQPNIMRIAVVAIFLLGAGLRFYALGSKSIWLDEAFTLWVAKHPLNEVWDWIARIDQHPPLFYQLLSLWVKFFGDSEFAIRSLPALLGTLTLPIFYLTARKVANPITALIALLLLAISPFHIHYAQETRMYTLLALAGCGAIYFLLRILARGNERQGDRETRRGGDWNMIGLAVCQAVGMWTHNTFAVFFLLALTIGIVYWQFTRRFSSPQNAINDSAFRFVPEGRIPHSALLLAQLLAFLLWLPWLVNFVRQSLKVDQEFWIGPPGLPQVFYVFMRFLHDHSLIPEISPVWVLLCLALAVWGFWRHRGQAPFNAGLLLSLWLTPLLAELLLGLRRPLLHPASLIWTTLPLYLLVAMGANAAVQAVPHLRRFGMLGFALLAIGFNLLGLFNYYVNVRKEQWADVAQFVSEQATAADLVLFNATWVQLPFEYYARRFGVGAEFHGVPVDLFDRGVTEPKMTKDDLPYLDQLIKVRQRIWLIYSHDWYTDPDQITLAELRSQLHEQQVKEFSGVRVFEFVQQ